jgi:hypothetical protein
VEYHELRHVDLRAHAACGAVDGDRTEQAATRAEPAIVLGILGNALE